MLHNLNFKQVLNTNMDTLWDFMSSPKNLAAITPQYMGFEIISDVENKKMYPGQIIEYHVKPIAGLKMHWVTEITMVKEHAYFIDEQRFGPYSFWHHKHFFKQIDNGIEMTDELHYKLPLGIIGKVSNAMFIQKQIQEIFDYRYLKLESLFNTSNGRKL